MASGNGSNRRRQRAIKTLWRRLPLSATARLSLGVALEGDGKLSDAMTQFDAAIALQPSMVAAHLRRAAILLGLGRSSEALDAAEEALCFDPGDGDAHELRASALSKLGRDREAVAAHAWARLSRASAP